MAPIRAFRRTGVADRLRAALAVSGLWRSAAWTLDSGLDGLAREWGVRAGADRAGMPSATAWALRRVGALAGLAGRAAAGGKGLTAAHLRLAARVDGRLALFAA